MTAKELKTALLQEAVQGKLVPQIASEGNARDLMEQIRKEKSKLIKEGKLKKEKPLPEITEEEIPFDIPDNWCWCRITDIATCELGKTKDAQKNRGQLKDYLCSINIQENGIDLSKIKQMKFEKDEVERYSVRKDDLLICEGGDAGRCAIFDLDTPMFYQNALHRVRFFNNINPIFYLYIFQLYKANNVLMEASKGVTIQHLTGESLRHLCFPLPPLAEQKRIVAAIEKFMPLIEEYGKKETELKAFNEQIGTLTKKAILQEAVQGKLVPQIAAEGNAKNLLEEIKKEKAKLVKDGKIKKEKPLPEITEDEIPFDIPENWCWCKLGEIINEFLVPQRDKPKVFSGNIPWCRIEDIEGMYLNGTLSNKYVSMETVKSMNLKVNPIGTVISANSASIGAAAITTVECCTNQTFIGLVCSGALYNYYLYYYLKSITNKLKKMGSGTTISYISQDKYKEMLFPLPPLAEQKRIVAAIEKMLSLCEKLGE